MYARFSSWAWSGRFAAIPRKSTAGRRLGEISRGIGVLSEGQLHAHPKRLSAWICGANPPSRYDLEMPLLLPRARKVATCERRAHEIAPHWLPPAAGVSR